MFRSTLLGIGYPTGSSVWYRLVTAKGGSLTFDEMARFVLDFLGRQGLRGSADVDTSLFGPLQHNRSLDDDDGWDLADLLTSGSPDPRSA